MSDIAEVYRQKKVAKLCKEVRELCAESSFAAPHGSAATSELSEIINAARERGCAEHGHEIKWLLELPMTDEEWKRFNELTGWPSRKRPNSVISNPPAKTGNANDLCKITTPRK